MKANITILALLIGCSTYLTTASAQAPKTEANTVTYEVTEDSDFEFTAYKVLGSQTGNFILFEGTVAITDGKIESAVIEGLADTESIETKSKMLKKILKSEKFFDVDEYPETIFSSTGIKKTEKGYDVTGDWTIRDTTKSVTFPAEITLKDGVFTLKAEFKVNRKDYGLTYKGISDNAIKDDIDIKWTIVAEAEEK